MSEFKIFAERLGTLVPTGTRVHVDEPAIPQGKWLATVATPEGYTIEIEWSRHLGFGLVAGCELEFGAGVDEVFGSAQGALDRISELLRDCSPTTKSAVTLAELRKLQRVLQKDVAERLGITKGGLAQIEGASSLDTMQIATLKRLIASLGGVLVLKARFAQGHEREITVE